MCATKYPEDCIAAQVQRSSTVVCVLNIQKKVTQVQRSQLMFCYFMVHISHLIHVHLKYSGLIDCMIIG